MISSGAAVDTTTSASPRVGRHIVALCRELRQAEALALLAVSLTPFALLADYRLGAAPIVDTISFRPLVENGGLPVVYQQLFGWTEILWISIGCAALSLRATRSGFRSTPTLLLVAFGAFLISVTALSGGVDRFASVAVMATVAPLLAMLGVLTHPDVRRRTIEVMVAYLAAISACVIILTAAKNLLHGQISERFSVFLFGSPTYAAAVFVALFFLVLGLSIVGPAIRLGLAAPLLLGIVLTQTRGGLAALVGGFISIGLMRRQLRLPALVAATIAAVLLIASPLRPLANASDSVRSKDVTHHLHLFLDRPVAGFGISNIHADAFRGADNTLVGIADAAGGVGLLLWCLIWLWPLLGRRSPRAEGPLVFAVGAIVATFISWITTGNEVLFYAPPTNLLPMVLGVGTLCAVSVPPKTSGDAPPTTDGHRWPLQTSAFSLVLGGALGAGIAVGITLFLVNRVEGDSRTRAHAAAEGVALSSCGSCRVRSLTEVTKGLWLARLSDAAVKPSACFYVNLADYYPMPPGVLPPGVTWVRCTS